MAHQARFEVSATATGWIRFRFAPLAPDGMDDYDVIEGGFENGHGYIFASIFMKQ